MVLDGKENLFFNAEDYEDFAERNKIVELQAIAHTLYVSENGSGNGDGENGNGGNGSGRSATDEVIDSALRYRVQAPLIDSLLADIGVEGGSLAKMPGLIREARDMQGIRQAAEPKKESGAKPAASSAAAPQSEGPPPPRAGKKA